MVEPRSRDLSLFFDILRTLDDHRVPYMIIGAFAGAIYGITRITYDIDIVVELDDSQIDRLAARYPPPRYYADPVQMRDSVRMGILFNIIDTERGEKANLIPLTMASRYKSAFQRRVQRAVELADGETLTVWCALPEDVIIGKLMAWDEGRSRKHETDIYEMLVFHFLGLDADLPADWDEAYIDRWALTMGDAVMEFWQSVKRQARLQAGRQGRSQ